MHCGAILCIQGNSLINPLIIFRSSSITTNEHYLGNLLLLDWDHDP